MLRCSKCGRDNEEGMRFCTNCGNTLAAAAPPPPAAGGTAYDPMQSETISFNAPPTTTPPSNWPTTPYTSATPPPSTASVPKSRSGLIIGVVAVLLLGMLGLAGAAGWYYYANTREVVTTNGNKNSGSLEPRSKSTPGDSNANTSPTPSASPSPASKTFEPPTVPTKEGTFTVYANRGWQLSEIAVVPLEQFTTTVDGIVDLAGIKTGVRAGGVNDAKTKSRRLYPEYPTGALLMRTRYADGHFSNVVAAGVSGSWENLPDERGMLEFAINDNSTEGNGGQFTIKVKLKSVPKSKK